MKRRERIEAVLMAVSSFYLLCLVMLDYYQNCSASNCAAAHTVLSPFHDFDFATIFPIVNLLPIPLTLRLFVPCLVLFATLLSSFFALRLKKGLSSAMLDVASLGLIVAFLFEAGLYFLDPYWWQVHFSNLTVVPFSLITNEDVTITCFSLLVLLVVARVILSKANSYQIAVNSSASKASE